MTREAVSPHGEASPDCGRKRASTSHDEQAPCPTKRFNDLLRRPRSRGLFCGIEVDHAATMALSRERAASGWEECWLFTGRLNSWETSVGG